MRERRSRLIRVVPVVLAAVMAIGSADRWDTDRRWSVKDSRICLNFQTRPASYVATTAEYCEVTRDKLCYDLVYNAQFTNTCKKAIEIRWKFPHSSDPSYSWQKLSPNEVRRVSCRKRLHRCDGMIEYNSRFPS